MFTGGVFLHHIFEPIDAYRPSSTKAEKGKVAKIDPAIKHLLEMPDSDFEKEIEARALKENPQEVLQQNAVDTGTEAIQGTIIRHKYTSDITVKKGDTFSGLLVKAGMARRDTFFAGEALSKVYNPKNLKVGQKVIIIFGESNKVLKKDGELEFLSLAIDEPEQVIELFPIKSDKKFSAKVIKKKLHRKVTRSGGIIDSSLYLLANKLKIPPNIISDAIAAFSFDVDFQRDIRKGNKFEVLYEGVFDNEGKKVRDGDLIYAMLTVAGHDMKIYRFTPPGDSADYYTEEGRSLRRSLLKTPIDGAIISSPFGQRKHPISGYSKKHKGVDFAAPRGTPFYAAGDGQITRIGRNGGYGNYIRIRHGVEYSTAYAHIKTFAKGMRKGRKVKQGQVIAYVGTTGRSTGPHLHYEILKNNVQINPMKINLPRGKKLNKKELKLFKQKKMKIDLL